jgi:hypothetical protein
MWKRMIAVFVFALAISPAIGRAQTVTPNLGLQIPLYNQSNWQVPLNYDLNLLDLLLSGHATLPGIVTNSIQMPAPPTDGSTQACFDALGFLSTGCGTNANRTCSLVYGSDNPAVSVLQNADIAPQGRQCFISNTSTIVEIDVSADAGTPSVVINKNHAGSKTNVLSSALATASAGGIACSNTTGLVGIDGVTLCSATLQNTSLAKGDYIETITATAGGTARRISIFVTFTSN